MTQKSPITVRTDAIAPWLKLFVVLHAKSPSDADLDIRFRPHSASPSPPDILDKLLEIASAAKAGDGEGFAVLSQPFLGTDDLADLIVDLRVDGIFSSFHFEVAANVWTCSECSSSGVQKANVSGYLIKKGKFLGREVKRYYMLDEAHLFYTTKERKNKPRRRIPVTDIVSVKETPGNIFEISVRKQKRAITLHANTSEDVQKWVRAIDTVIVNSTK